MLSRVIVLVYNQITNFCPKLIMLGLKKFRVVTNIFEGLKNHNFLKFIYNKYKISGQGGPVATLNRT